MKFYKIFKFHTNSSLCVIFENNSYVMKRVYFIIEEKIIFYYFYFIEIYFNIFHYFLYKYPIFFNYLIIVLTIICKFICLCENKFQKFAFSLINRRYFMFYPFCLNNNYRVWFRVDSFFT